MGDKRFKEPLDELRSAANRVHAIRALTDDEVIGALTEASLSGDPLLANVLATEAMNRSRRKAAVVDAVGDGVISVNALGA